MSEGIPIPHNKDSSLETITVRVDHLLEQGVGKMNEDAIFVGDTAWGVFDGVSSLDGGTNDQGQTGGVYGSEHRKGDV